jgi:RecA-family ATPase
VSQSDVKSRIVDLAVNGTSSNGSAPHTEHTTPPRPNIRLLTAKQLEEIPPPKALIDGVLFQNTLANVVAPFDAFKTFLCLGMGLSIAHGADWYGRGVGDGIVTYSIGEGLHDFGRRMKAWKQQWKTDDVPNFYTCPEAFALNNPAHVERFLAEVDKLGARPVLCVFDTLARHLRGADSDQKDADGYIHGADTIRQETGACVLSVHHEGWAKRQGQSQSRGSTNIPGALDTEISVDRCRAITSSRCRARR